jgi:hypothetical protein
MFLGRREAAPARTTARTVAGSPQLLAAITLRLSPGMSKDAGARAARMPLPPDGAPVRLVAELPGLAAPAECTARLYLPGADGTWTKVWNSGPARTAAEGHTQELTVVLPPATLHSGDYVLEAAAPDGRVRERYVFRVSPAE